MLDLSTVEQTTRKRSERAPAEQVEETPQADTDRDAQLSEIDDLLDEIEEVLDDNDELVIESRDRILLADIDANRTDDDAQLARIGLYSPDDLEEEVAADLAAYADEVAAREAEELQAELLRYVNQQNPPCYVCGACPVRPGCPFQAEGERFFKGFDGTYVAV